MLTTAKACKAIEIVGRLHPIYTRKINEVRGGYRRVKWWNCGPTFAKSAGTAFKKAGIDFEVSKTGPHNDLTSLIIRVPIDFMTPYSNRPDPKQAKASKAYHAAVKQLQKYKDQRKVLDRRIESLTNRIRFGGL